jgi:FkbH-like protein
MQPLVQFLKPWDVVSGAYNAILADLTAIDSRASQRDITHVLCLYDAGALMGDALYGFGEAAQCEALLTALDGYCARQPEKVVVTHTFCLSSSRWLGFADITNRASLKTTEAALNTRLISLTNTHPNLLVFDIELLFRRFGEDALTSNAFWYAGRIRYTARMFELLANTIRNAVNAYAQRSRKVLILDLDNTLWGGVVGEVGPAGIDLSEDGKGRCYRDFQRALKALQNIGVLLAASSKNNAADVNEVFESNPMMVLRREDFAAMRANWESKVENIVAIAEELDLGTDSFVFLDDSPVERQAIKSFLPDVAVPDFPKSPEKLASWLLQEVAPNYFGKYVLTPEDTVKTEQYHARTARRKLAVNFDLDSYLADLGIECTIHVDSVNRLVRAAQMTQKTNQFNLTTRRYEVTDLTRFTESPDHAVLLLDYKDRFGDEGSVGLAIIDLAESRIDTLLASCRVIGRKIEHRLVDRAVELCRLRGHRKIVGEYIPTKKNQLVAKFYDGCGFARLAEQPDGRVLYEKGIP